jgi:hypothetical protein
LKYLNIRTTGNKAELISRIFQTESSVTIPETLLNKEKQVSKPDNRKEAEKNLKMAFEMEKQQVMKELSDKGNRLSAHFHSCSTRCNGGSAEVLRKSLLNCLKHWAGDHSSCVSETCLSLVYSSKILLTHVLSFAVLYFVFTSGKPGTVMTLESLEFYTKDVATSICESFHSYLSLWAPKGIYFSSSYETRIFMAELCWNANVHREKKILPRRKEPDKGKRARGRLRSLRKTPLILTWVEDIFSQMKNLDEPMVSPFLLFNT